MRPHLYALTFILTLISAFATPASAQTTPHNLHLIAQSRASTEPVVARCLIGKPSYCLKYGGTLCEKGNKKKNAKAACTKWVEGCLTCHNAVPTCLNNNRTNVPQSKCDRCRTNWNSCMATNDRRHWPNRMKGN